MLDNLRAESAAYYSGNNGDSYFTKSDNATLDGSALVLDSAGGQLSWAIYDFGEVRFDLADSTLLIGHTPQSAGTLHIALPNYARGTWDLFSVEVTAGQRSDELPIPQFSPYLSGTGKSYVGLLAWDGFDTRLESIDLAVGVVNAAPANLSASQGTSAERIDLSWDPVDHAYGYLVDFMPQSGTEWEVLCGPPGVQENYTAHTYSGEPGSDPIYGEVYRYRVRTYFEDGDTSASSNVAFGWRSLPAPVAVNATQNIYVGKVKVWWFEVSQATSYLVFRRPPGGEQAVIGETTDTYLLDETVPDAGDYEYMVVACDGENYSPWSSWATGSALGFTYSDFQVLCDTKPDIRMMEINGTLCAGYFDTRYDDLFFAQATTATPSGPGSWERFDLGRGQDSGELTLGALGGKPAMAFRLAATDSTEFIWCDAQVPLDSPTWYPTSLDKTGEALGRPSWIETGGVPVVSYHTDLTGSDPGMYFFYATTPTPMSEDDWQSYVLEPGGSAGMTCSLALCNGLPVVLGNMDGFVGFYYDAASIPLPLSPTDWALGRTAQGSDTSRNVELFVHNDQAFYATSVFIYSTEPCWMVMLSQALKSLPLQQLDWWSSGVLDNEPNNLGECLDLTYIADRPALCYYDDGAQCLRLAMSEAYSPVQEDWAVSTVAAGPGMGQACAMTEFGGLPVLLYWDQPAQKIVLAQGE